MKSQDYPDGFIVHCHYPGTFTLTYRTRGMGCMMTFLWVWLVGFGGIWGLIALSNFSQIIKFLESFNPSENWPVIFCFTGAGLAYFYCLFLLLWKAFGVTTFEISPNTLLVTKQLFSFKRLRKALASDMVKLKQIKDGGKGRDSFPSWKLLIYAPKKICLLDRERIEKSDWLGEFLTDYYKIEFQTSPERR